MKVVAYKLTTGDEIIGYQQETLTGSTLSKVRSVQLTSTPGGGIGFALFPWVACNPDMEVTLTPSMIAFEIEPLKAIEDSYVAQTSVVKPASTMPQGISGGIIKS